MRLDSALYKMKTKGLHTESDIFVCWKINTTSRCDNHASETFFRHKKFGSGSIFCIFAYVAFILIGKAKENGKTHANISDSVCNVLNLKINRETENYILLMWVVCCSLCQQAETPPVWRFCGTSNRGKRSPVTMEMDSLEKTMNSVNAILVKGIMCCMPVVSHLPSIHQLGMNEYNSILYWKVIVYTVATCSSI